MEELLFYFGRAYYRNFTVKSYKKQPKQEQAGLISDKTTILLFVLEPDTFRGNVTVTHTERPNPLIGPSGAQLVSLGALFPPCIREDHALNVQQVQALYPRPGSDGEGLGCCEVPQSNIAGTATEV